MDILFVVATAARLALADPDSMGALLRLPLSLLPTFLVPLIIASHLLLAIRLARLPEPQRAKAAEAAERCVLRPPQMASISRPGKVKHQQ